MHRLLLPLLAALLAAPLQADSVDATAEAYFAAIQAQDWQKMATFLDADSHYQDFTMEHFDRPRIDLRGGEAIVEFWRTASEDSGTSDIRLDFDERFVAGPNLFLLGHSEVKTEGAAWGLPVESLDTRFPQITHLRIEEGRVTYHADHVDYGTAERQIAEQVEAWRKEHGGDASFPVTAVDASLKKRAEEYLANLREKRWDDAAAFLGDGSQYQNFSVEHFGRSSVHVSGAQALLDHFRSTSEKQQVVESSFEVERYFISGSNVFLVGFGYVKKRATAWEMPQDVVDARFRQIHHVRLEDGKVTYHADHVDHAAAEVEFDRMARSKKEQAEALMDVEGTEVHASTVTVRE